MCGGDAGKTDNIPGKTDNVPGKTDNIPGKTDNVPGKVCYLSAKMDSELKIQAGFHTWLWNTYPRTRGLCFHIPNGGSRQAIEAFQMKASGVVAGIPDYFVSIPANGFPGLYIEFKAEGKISIASSTDHGRKQAKRQQALIAAGYRVEVCDSIEAARLHLLDYLSNTNYLIIN